MPSVHEDSTATPAASSAASTDSSGPTGIRSPVELTTTSNAWSVSPGGSSRSGALNRSSRSSDGSSMASATASMSGVGPQQ